MTEWFPWFGSELTLTSYDVVSYEWDRTLLMSVVYHSQFASPMRCGREAHSGDTYESHGARHGNFYGVCCTACLYRYPEFSRDFATT